MKDNENYNLDFHYNFKMGCDPLPLCLMGSMTF